MASGPNNAFRTAFINRVKKAVLDAEGVDDVPHQGVKGKAREIFVKAMLQPVLPPEVRIGSGQLVSVDGQYSGEIDALLYSPSVMPPALHDEQHGLFPVEAALYAFEVKSKLTATKLKESIATSQKIKALPLMGTNHWHVGPAPAAQLDENGQVRIQHNRFQTNIADIVKVLFAFATDLAPGGMSELDRYRQYDPNADTDPAFQAICVVGRGYWYEQKGGAGWMYQSATDDFREVMALLAGTSNTLPQLLSAKGRPKFGKYLIDENFVQA